jgi:Squalene-hopene cyclase C-terminal domain
MLCPRSPPNRATVAVLLHDGSFRRHVHAAGFHHHRVLCALNAAGVDHQDPVIRQAANWLLSIQNMDGGF